MPRKPRVVNINDDSTYGEVAEAMLENELAETQEGERTETPEVEPPKPKARAKRVPKPKAVVDDTAIEPESAPEPEVSPKPRAKRTPKVKVVELPPVVEEPVVKPKAQRKPRAVKEELHVQKPNNQVPPFPPRLSRTAAREALYHSLASGGLS
jgi:hypothetical protein